MAKSLEDVIVSYNHVKNKKCEGTLYLLSERLTWMPATRKTFTISYNYEDIKSQKISLDSKEKVQLQVVLHANGASTFHFNNPLGRAAQISERDLIKEHLQVLLSKFKKKANTELEEKNKKLQDDPKLFLLYKNLVASGVITADEFWINHYNAFNFDVSKQETGISASFLSDVQCKTDGCNGVRYNLTFDIIQSIFKTYPAVERKHADSVPDKISEQDFWTQFFQSHYFHRDRINIADKELFSDCAKKDELFLRIELEKSLADSSINLNKLFERSSEEDYLMSQEHLRADSIPANASLVKRFNQHSTMVLKACDTFTNSNMSDNGNSNHLGAAMGQSNSLNGDHDKDCNKSAKKPQETDNLEMDASEGGASDEPALKLTRIDAYLHGPTPLQTLQYNTPDELYNATRSLTHEVMAWKTIAPKQNLLNNNAINVLWELSPTSNLMQSSNGQHMSEIVPKDLQLELKCLYLSLGELLRHFWACFPITTPELQEKVERMYDSLQRFQQNKISPVSDKLLQQHLPSELLNHLNSMHEQAISKFRTWQMKKTSIKKI